MIVQIKKYKIAEFLLFALSSLYLFLILYSAYEIRVFQTLEDLLFDVNTRIKPQISEMTDISVVTISQEDIYSIEGADKQTLSPEGLAKIVDQILLAKPKALGIILPSQDFDYRDQKLIAMMHRYKDIANLYWGDFVVSTKSSKLEPQNKITNILPKNVYSANSLITYKTSIIRDLRLLDYRDGFMSPHIITKIAKDHGGEEVKNAIDHIIEKAGINALINLNYSEPHTFKSLESIDVLAGHFHSELTDKIVLVGYTAFRDQSIEDKDGTYRNSPWQSENEAITAESAMPLVYILSSGLRNLMQMNWLSETPVYWEVIQAAVFSLVCFMIWMNPAVHAIVYLILVFFALVYFNSLMMFYLNIRILYANTIMIGFFATILGAFWRAHRDNKARSIKFAKASFRRKMASIQENFINKFAIEIFELNAKVKSLLEKNRVLPDANKSFANNYNQAYASAVELEEFLSGLKQFASLDSYEIKKVKKVSIDLILLIHKIVNQFTTQIAENKLQITYPKQEKAICWSDNLYLEPIIFNLISNAIKYSPKDGKVIISIYELANNSYVLSVYNEGVGISEEHQQRIFEKFYRIKDDRIYKVKGNGLGLYLAQFFANKIGKKIKVSSQPGQGATFSVEIQKGKI